MHSTKIRIPLLLMAMLLLVSIPLFAFGEETDIREITVPNKPVKGLIEIEKQGPVLKGFLTHQDPFGNTVNTPIYETGYLEGAVFEIRAVEDIVGKDGTEWFKAGDLADTVVTTGEKADMSKLLPLGHYYVTEVAAPDGYAFDSVRYDVVLEAKDHETPIVSIGVIATNNYMPTHISLEKEKEVTSTQKDNDGFVHTAIETVPGEGFVFGLYTSEDIAYPGGVMPNGSLIATAVSDKEGHVSFRGSLPAARYMLKEISGPEGWEIDPVYRPVAIPADAQIINGEMVISLHTPIVNKLVHADVKVSKTDLTGSDYLPHTMIEIRNGADEIVLRDYTGEDGYLPAFPAVPGFYTYREVLAPEGYELSRTELSFRIRQDGKIEGKTAVADDFTRFSVKKENETHEPLAGVEFSLIRENGAVQAKAITDVNGLAIFEKIPYGTYTIRETKALPGYLMNTETATITIDGTFVNPEKPVATFINCLSEILIQKVDQNGTAVQGAEFGLYDADGKLVMTAASDAEGMVRFTGAAYGKYTIRELSAPVGYLMNHDVISISIDEGYVNSNKPAATVENPEKKIMCIKSDTSGKPIPGVEFSLLDAATMEVVETAASDKDGVFTFHNFDYGDWIIRESKAPDGYSPMEDVRFHVGDGWSQPKPILCVNIPNHYEFKKTDSDGNPLAGVKFRLEDEKGKELGIYESDKDGLVQIKDLLPGNYIIREIETLEGYTVSGEVIKLKLDEYYVSPEKLRQFVNYTTIQTGVHMAVTGIMWVGLGLMAVSGTVGLIRRRRQRKTK